MKKITSVLIGFLLITSCGNQSEPPEYDEFHTNNMTQEHLIDGPLIEATSLFGAGLVRPSFDENSTEILQAELQQAIRNYHDKPDIPESILWIARKTADFWRFQDAILVLTDGIDQYSEDARFYRHRGHYLTAIREFSIAEEDLYKATKLIESTLDIAEPDNIDGSVIEPASTLHYNIWLYFGFVQYVLGDFVDAAEAFQSAYDIAGNEDTRITAADWLYLSLIRSNQTDKAQKVLQNVNTRTDVSDAKSYQVRLQMYGYGSAEFNIDETMQNPFERITILYGKAMILMNQGEEVQAKQVLNEILDSNLWAALSYIAAESDLHRLRDSSI